MSKVLAVIPARMASTRLPGKPMLDRTGRPMIVHVVERARSAACVDRVIVATDDARIADAVCAHGGEAVMTRTDHTNGTSRIAEVVAGLKGNDRPSVVVNVQGDEPEIEPELIDKLVAGLQADAGAPMATLACPFGDGEDASNPNVVKVVVTRGGPCRALYFSRLPVPMVRDVSASKTADAGDANTGAAGLTRLKHPGLYAYRTDFLLAYVTLAATPCEQAEQLEQLRALEHGHAIAVVQVDHVQQGIDTPEQYDAFVQRWQASQGNA